MSKRNGTGCKFCPSHEPTRTLDDGRYRLAYCPVCYAVTAAWERDGRCLSPVAVESLTVFPGGFTMLDLGEGKARSPGRRSADPLDMAGYRDDDGERAEGVPIQTPMKVS